MLDSHQELAIPPETHFIPALYHPTRILKRKTSVFFRLELLFFKYLTSDRNFFFQFLTRHERWPDFQIDASNFRHELEKIEPFNVPEGLRTFYTIYAARFGKRRWGDKTPAYVRSMKLISSILPEARFIHLIRDGRDVMLSGNGLWFGSRSAEEAAASWVRTMQEARRQAQDLPYYMEVRYEDLVRRPQECLMKICTFLSLEWDAAMLEYHLRADARLSEIKRDIVLKDNKIIEAAARVGIHKMTYRKPDPFRIGRWKHEMTPEDRCIFEAVAGSTLKDLGYEA